MADIKETIQTLVKQSLDSAAKNLSAEIYDKLLLLSNEGKLVFLNPLLINGSVLHENEMKYFSGYLDSNNIIDIKKVYDPICDNLLLIVGSRIGNLDLVKFLVERGACVDKIAGVEHGPLDVSAYNGNLEIVKYLIQKGANINESFALYNSADGEAEDVYNFLIANAANFNLALNHSVEKGNLDVMKFLFDRFPRCYAAYDISDILIKSAKKGYIDIVKYLTQIVFDKRLFFINTGAFDRIAECGNLDVVKYLIDAHFSINLNLSLENSLQKNNIEMVKFLIDRGANPSKVQHVIDYEKNLDPKIVQYVLNKRVEQANSNLEKAKFELDKFLKIV